MLSQQIPNFLLKRAFLTPERPAIQFQNQTYTFADLYKRSDYIAGQLTQMGVRKGQFVGVLLTNHVDTIFIYLAFQLIGVRAVILNNRLTTEELTYQLNDSKAEGLITERIFSKIGAELNDLIPHVKQIMKEELFQTSFSKPELVEEISLEDVCTVMYTSGTTGHPKGVLHSYGNHWWSAIGSALNLGLSEKDCWLCAVPLFHISGYSIFIRSIIYGVKMVLVESFNEMETIKIIKKDKVTIMSVVSTMLSRIEEELKDDHLPNEFRCMLLGGGPAPKNLLEKCKRKKIPVYQTYGMTETSSQIVTLSPEYSLSKLGSAGKVLFPSQLKIINREGNDALPHEEGEIFVKGPNVTRGYLNQKNETDKKIIDGWLATGDIGFLDEEGFLYVLDRRSDLIISGGENIYPAEIEGVLLSHSQVMDAGVIGVKDHQWGEVPIAFIVKESSLCKEELTHYCSQRLAKYKIPKEVYFIDKIPRNASKKLLRRELRLMAEKMKEK